MFANGPQWTSAGWPSSVCTRFGLIVVLEQHGHRAGRLQLLGGHRLAVEGRADGDRAESRAQVVEVAGDGDDRHHLGGGGDVEAGLARVAVRAAAEPDDDVAQRAVVDVDAAPPRDRERVDAELVAVQEVRLEHRREQVVRGADRVDVAGEVEVQVLHRHDLRVAAAGRAALDPEHRAERRLAEAEHGLAADRAEALRERDRRRRLALAGLRRRDRRDADELAVGPVGEPVEHRERDLRLVACRTARPRPARARPPRRPRRSGGAGPPARSRERRVSPSPRLAPFYTPRPLLARENKLATSQERSPQLSGDRGRGAARRRREDAGAATGRVTAALAACPAELAARYAGDEAAAGARTPSRRARRARGCGHGGVHGLHGGSERGERAEIVRVPEEIARRADEAVEIALRAAERGAAAWPGMPGPPPSWTRRGPRRPRPRGPQPRGILSSRPR